MQKPLLQPHLASDTNVAERQFSPSTVIDAALCDLLQRITNFSDSDFDAEWFSLSEVELEGLVVQLLQHLADTLDGKQLSGYLLRLRADAGSEAPPE